MMMTLRICSSFSITSNEEVLAFNVEVEGKLVYNLLFNCQNTERAAKGSKKKESSTYEKHHFLHSLDVRTAESKRKGISKIFTPLTGAPASTSKGTIDDNTLQF